jgi:hypothetical protein
VDRKIRDHSDVRVNIKIQGTNMISINVENIVFVDVPEEDGYREDTRIYRVHTTTKTLESFVNIYRNSKSENIVAITFQCNYNDMNRIFTTLFSKEDNK